MAQFQVTSFIGRDMFSAAAALVAMWTMVDRPLQKFS